MKKRDLIAKLRKATRAEGLSFAIEEGSRHHIAKIDKLRIPIPRHTEINEDTAKSILKQAEQKLGEDWWR